MGAPDALRRDVAIREEVIDATPFGTAAAVSAGVVGGCTAVEPPTGVASGTLNGGSVAPPARADQAAEAWSLGVASRSVG